MHLNMTSGDWGPFCLGLNKLTNNHDVDALGFYSDTMLITVAADGQPASGPMP